MKTSPVMLISRCTKVAAILLLAMSSCCARKHAEEPSRLPGKAVTSGGESSIPPAAEAKSSSAPANESPPVLFKKVGWIYYDEPDLHAIANHLELMDDGWAICLVIAVKLRDHPDQVAVAEIDLQIGEVIFEKIALMKRVEALRGVAPLARIAPVTALLQDVETFNEHMRWLYSSCKSLLDSYPPVAKVEPTKVTK